MRTAIIVSIGRDQVKVKGYRNIVKTMLECDGEKGLYWWRMKNIPAEPGRKDIFKAFVTVGGKVRWMADILEWIPDVTAVEFRDGRIMTARWMILINFQPVMIKVPLKGFQGFRYVKPDSELAQYYNL